MALIDYTNKVIYWDEVNWTWLPHVTLRESKNYFLVLRGVGSFPVKCAEDASKLLIREGYCLSTLKDLGVTEVSRGTFIFKESLYELGSRANIVSLISIISGMSKSWVSSKITGKGIISTSLFQELSLGVPKLKYKGKLYSGYNSLAKELGISRAYMYHGISKGWTIEEVISEYNKKYTTDHLGNVFNNQKDMLKYWGISLNTYKKRLKDGWSLKDSLSTPVRKIRKPKEYTDFRGIVFTSASSMAKEYGVSSSALLQLLDKGKSSEEVTLYLFQKSQGIGRFKDHLGNEFLTRSEMLKVYGVKHQTFSKRLRLGWSLEEALTGKRNKKIKSNK